MSTSESNGTSNYAQQHHPDCDSTVGAMIFDAKCDRCKKINIIIQLKRKNTNNGCSLEEALTASLMVERLIKQYNIPEGDIVDLEYENVAVVKRQQAQKTYHKQYGAAKARHTYSRYHAPIHTWEQRRQYDEELTDE